MSIKRLSLLIVGIIWLLVGTILGIVGIRWLLTISFGPKVIILFIICVALGLLKGRYVLQKVAAKYCKRSSNIHFHSTDLVIGWIKILGIKGFILISLMILIGIILRHSSIDRPILGIIYLSVGIALVYASKIFFTKSNKD